MEKDISKRILVGQSTIQSGNQEPQTLDVYRLIPDLPAAAKKRNICFDHIAEGAAEELMNDFDLGGVRFPEVDEPQEITTQLSCKGVSCILKKCGLTVEQYDSEGQKIGEMKVLDS